MTASLCGVINLRTPVEEALAKETYPKVIPFSAVDLYSPTNT